MPVNHIGFIFDSPCFYACVAIKILQIASRNHCDIIIPKILRRATFATAKLRLFALLP